MLHRQHDQASGLAIPVGKGSVVQPYVLDLDHQGSRLVAFGGRAGNRRRYGRLPCGEHPIRLTLGAGFEQNVWTRHDQPIDLDPTAKQRQHGQLQVDALHRRHFRAGEPGWVGQHDILDLDRGAKRECEANMALQHDISSGRLLNRVNDARLPGFRVERRDADHDAAKHKDEQSAD